MTEVLLCIYCTNISGAEMPLLNVLFLSGMFESFFKDTSVSWILTKKTQNLCKLLSVFWFWKISILILSIAGSGKIFLLEWDCSGFPSITPLFSTYASLIVLLLIRLSIFVETFFFKLGIQIWNLQIKHTVQWVSWSICAATQFFYISFCGTCTSWTLSS